MARRNALTDRITDAALRAMIGLARCLPYRWRVPVFGWMSARVIAPLAGWRQRIRDNLAHVAPDMPGAEVERILRAAPDNAGRSMIEMYSGEDFLDRIRATPLSGPGIAALDDALATGRPIILATAHYGNYNAARAALLAHGVEIGALYRPPNNPLFSTHYTRDLSAIGGRLFKRDRSGMAQMLRHLKSGKALMILYDLHVTKGVPLDFMDQPALTSLAPGEMALRHDALLIPFYGIRKADGLSFTIRVDAPVPHTTPEQMMRELHAGLEELIAQDPTQWNFMHRRWKGAQRRAP